MSGSTSSADSEDDCDIDTRGKQLKIVFVGEANVGKSSLIRRFCYDEFTRQYNQTVGADFYIKRILLPGRKEITLKITDIGSNELNGHMLPNYLFNANLIILVYDITSTTSFDGLPQWIRSIEKCMDNPPINVLIGNKCDLEHQRTVRLDKTKEFVKTIQLSCYLTSAKTGEAVNSSLMDSIAKHVGIPLTKLEKEQHESVIRAELIAPEPIRSVVASSNHSVLCILQ